MTYTEREPRKEVALDVELKDFKFTEISADNAENISRGGAFIRMDAPHKVGTLIKFDIAVGEDQTISGVARVVWQREEEDKEKGPPGIGVKFVKLEPESRSLLEELLSAEDDTSTAGTEDASATESEEPESNPDVVREAPSASGEAEEASESKTTSEVSEAESSTAAERSSAPPPDDGQDRATVAVPPPKSQSNPLLYVILGGALIAGIVLYAMRNCDGDPEEAASVDAQKVETGEISVPSGNSPPKPTVAEAPVASAAKNEKVAAAAREEKIAEVPGTVGEGDDAKAAEEAEVATNAEPASGASVPENEASAAAGGAVLKLASTPGGASVTIDGRVRDGVTPMVIEGLSEGKEVEISLKREGYMTVSQTFIPEKAENELAIPLAAARLKFRFSTTPSGARIILDDKFNGKTPYTFLRNKYRSKFKYRLEKRGFKPVEGVIGRDDWVEEDGRYYVFALKTPLESKK